MTQDLLVEDFFGTTEEKTCPFNNITCVPAFRESWEGAFNCLCGGPTSDYKWVSGAINGKAPYKPEGSPFMKNFYRVQVEQGKRYRVRVNNQGFNYGLRFSIDDRTFDLI